jgi:hypothetical protein
MWRLFLLTLLACVTATAAVAQPGPQPTGGVWTAAGERACDGRSWGASYGRTEPDPAMCTPTSDGMTAVCGDNQCRYRAVTPDQCRSDGATSKIYRCRAPAVSKAEAAKAVCSATKSGPWPDAGTGYSITVVVDGETCASAILTVIIRRPDGAPIFTHTVAARWSVMFQDVKAPQDLNQLLQSLLQRSKYTSDSLPAWETDSRYRPEPGVTEEQWNAWRAAKLPILAFTWGIETDHIYVLEENGSIREIAGHTPG